MPTVPTPTLADIPKAESRKLEKLLFERDFLTCSLSYSKLFKLLAGNDDPDAAVEAIRDCIVAYNDEEAKAVKDGLKEQIADIYLNHNIKSIRHEDPFGRRLDNILYESTTPGRLDKTKMLELAPKFKINGKVLKELMDAATVPGSPYVAMKVVEVKPDKNKE